MSPKNSIKVPAGVRASNRDFKIGHYGRLGRLDAYTGGLWGYDCDSRIGFGTEGYPDNSSSCGNGAKHLPDNGEKHIKAMGYILVQ